MYIGGGRWSMQVCVYSCVVVLSIFCFDVNGLFWFLFVCLFVVVVVVVFVCVCVCMLIDHSCTIKTSRRLDERNRCNFATFTPRPSRKAVSPQWQHEPGKGLERERSHAEPEGKQESVPDTRHQPPRCSSCSHSPPPKH